MSIFHYHILKAINGYKAILRRNLDRASYANKIAELGIKRSTLKGANDPKLYELGTKIVAELEQHMLDSSRARSASFYYGEEEFLQYLKKLLAEYCVESDRVINAAQKTSCALVDLIQLIGSAKDRLIDEVAEQIYQCSRVIAKHGSREQKKIFHRIINSKHPKHVNLFFRQLRDLVPYFEE